MKLELFLGFEERTQLVQLGFIQISDASLAQISDLVLHHLRSFAASDDGGQALNLSFGVGLSARRCRSFGGLLELFDTLDLTGRRIDAFILDLGSLGYGDSGIGFFT